MGLTRVFGTRARDQALGKSHNSLWRVALVRWPVLAYYTRIVHLSPPS